MRTLMKATVIVFLELLHTMQSSANFVLGGPYGFQQCIHECLLRKSCHSVGFLRKHLQCELSDGEPFILDSSDFGFKKVNRSEMTEYETQLGNCAKHVCGAVEKCVEMKSGLKKCVGIVACNSRIGYTVRYSENSFVCQKVYLRGNGKVKYNAAKEQCQGDGGRLMIMDAEWKVHTMELVLLSISLGVLGSAAKDHCNLNWFMSNVSTVKYTLRMQVNLARCYRGGVTADNGVFINGEKTDNGHWKFSNDRDFIQLSNVTYSLNYGSTVVLSPTRGFLGKEGTSHYGFICEMFNIAF